MTEKLFLHQRVRWDINIDQSQEDLHLLRRFNYYISYKEN